MPNELSALVQDIEASLANRPKEHSKPLYKFNEGDERIVSLFLQSVGNYSSFRALKEKFSEWDILIGNNESVSSPVKYIQQRINSKDELGEILSHYTGDFINSGIKPRTVSYFGGLPEMFKRLLTMKEGLYESVLAFYSQIIDELKEERKPLNLLTADEIYRRAFSLEITFETANPEKFSPHTKKKFDWFNNSILQTQMAFLDSLYKIDYEKNLEFLKSFSEEKSEKTDPTILFRDIQHEIFPEGLKNIISSARLPPLEVSLKYFKDGKRSISSYSRHIFIDSNPDPKISKPECREIIR